MRLSIVHYFCFVRPHASVCFIFILYTVRHTLHTIYLSIYIALQRMYISHDTLVLVIIYLEIYGISLSFQ